MPLRVWRCRSCGGVALDTLTRLTLSSPPPSVPSRAHEVVAGEIAGVKTDSPPLPFHSHKCSYEPRTLHWSVGNGMMEPSQQGNTRHRHRCSTRWAPHGTTRREPEGSPGIVAMLSANGTTPHNTPTKRSTQHTISTHPLTSRWHGVPLSHQSSTSWSHSSSTSSSTSAVLPSQPTAPPAATNVSDTAARRRKKPTTSPARHRPSA